MNFERLKDISEEALIKRITRGRVMASEYVVVDNGDDAAVWTHKNADAFLVASTDSLVEGVHFKELTEATGRKLLSVNLSDLASMGACPQYALLSLHLSPELEVESVEAMARGFHAHAHKFDIQLIGGNVTRTTGPAVLALTLLGDTKSPLCRGRANVGDGIFVTGTLGDARAGLELESGFLFEAQVDPIPRVLAGQALSAADVVTSMCDISDGLAKDLRHLVSNTKMGVCIEEALLPVSAELQAYAGNRALEYAVQGGEDYELLFTAHDELRVKRACALSGTRVTRIGEVLGQSQFHLRSVDGNTKPLLGGFSHFGSDCEL